jgi:hypothetical protein
MPEKVGIYFTQVARMVKIFKAFESVEPAMMDSLHEN